MTKRETASLFIKIIGIFFLAGSAGFFELFLISIMNVRTYDVTTFIAPLVQLIPILVYLTVLFLIVVKSDVIAAKLIKKDGEFNFSLTVNKDEILMIAFCCIGLSLLIKVVPNIIFVFVQSVSYIRKSNMFPYDVQSSYWSMIGLLRFVSIIFNSVIGYYLFFHSKDAVNLWKKFRKDGNEDMYQFGEVKSIDALSFDDMQQYPIWVMDTGKGGKGKSFVRPVINSVNITVDLIDPLIGFRVQDSDLLGSADYNQDGQRLENLTLWIDGKWVLIQDSTDLVPPLTLIAIPQIDGCCNVKFKYESFEKSNAYLSE